MSFVCATAVGAGLAAGMLLIQRLETSPLWRLGYVGIFAVIFVVGVRA